MRTKDEIFDDIEKISGKEEWSPEMIVCLTVIYLEVLIDIRDALVISEKVLISIYDSIVNTD